MLHLWVAVRWLYFTWGLLKGEGRVRKISLVAPSGNLARCWSLSVLRQLTSGEVWVQFNDGSQLVVQAGVSCITYTSPDGGVTRYETHRLSSHLGFYADLSPLPPPSLAGTKRTRSCPSTSRRSCTASPPSWACWPTPPCNISVTDGSLNSSSKKACVFTSRLVCL